VPYIQANLSVDYAMRGLCVKPYLGHVHGCPNFHRRSDCPPQCKFILEILDFTKPIYVIYNRFDLKSHIEKMRFKHLQCQNDNFIVVFIGSQELENSL
jgi:hypothetical protein